MKGRRNEALRTRDTTDPDGPFYLQGAHSTARWGHGVWLQPLPVATAVTRRTPVGSPPDAAGTRSGARAGYAF